MDSDRSLDNLGDHGTAAVAILLLLLLILLLRLLFLGVARLLVAGPVLHLTLAAAVPLAAAPRAPATTFGLH